MRRVLAMSAVLAIVLAGCTMKLVAPKETAHHPAAHPSAARHTAARHTTPHHDAQPVKNSGALSVLVEPSAGIGRIYQLIDRARFSIELTMYELRDATAERDLAAAAA